MYKLLISVIVLLEAIPNADFLECYSYHPNPGGDLMPQPYHSVKCSPESTACHTNRIDSDTTTQRSYFCSGSHPCHSVADQRNSSYLFTSTCCYNDLCNNGTTDPQFEDGEKYCYSATCRGKDCLTGLLARIEKERLGTYCNANGSSCQIQHRNVLSASGTWDVINWSGCATPRKCSPHMNIEHNHIFYISCCDTHLCNGPNKTAEEIIDPNKNYCYQYSCLSDRKDKCQSPLEHDKAVKEGRAELCPMTNKGCYRCREWYNSTHYVTTLLPIRYRAWLSIIRMLRTSGCFTEDLLNAKNCTDHLDISLNFTSIWQCCNTDRCNNFIDQRDDLKPDQCYRMQCSGNGCLQTSKIAGSYLLCDMTDFGCEVVTLETAVDTVYFSGCSSSACHRGHVRSDGTKVVSCCNEDRCLPPDYTSAAFLSQPIWTAIIITIAFYLTQKYGI